MKNLKVFIYTVLILINTNQLYGQQVNTKITDLNSILKFTNGNYNMGKIPFGKPSDYDITIENISNDTIILQNISTQCNCTTPYFVPGEIILPKSVIKVKIGFNGKTEGNFNKVGTLHFSNKLIQNFRFSGETYK